MNFMNDIAFMNIQSQTFHTHNIIDYGTKNISELVIKCSGSSSFQTVKT